MRHDRSTAASAGLAVTVAMARAGRPRSAQDHRPGQKSRRERSPTTGCPDARPVQIGGRDIAGMAAAPDQVQRAIITMMP